MYTDIFLHFWSLFILSTGGRLTKYFYLQDTTVNAQTDTPDQRGAVIDRIDAKENNILGVSGVAVLNTREQSCDVSTNH